MSDAYSATARSAFVRSETEIDISVGVKDATCEAANVTGIMRVPLQGSGSGCLLGGRSRSLLCLVADQAFRALRTERINEVHIPKVP
ncbi:hypothetical protein GCM10012287_46910 [Streptomyces daqingensis]|uniref:Uncharacterized protein n=1 Tax=Streptomyces daqingensis TaxID=1472640 RepID=A0ABQ2MSM4_9ACTN|nr:hypothetical protein GCM10012287_46910 [Streptomyces daqingensis]